MHKVLEELKTEHEALEQELDEIEVAFSGEYINYSNLTHCLKDLFNLWDQHEFKEEEFFRALEDLNYGIPFKQILFEHGVLGRHKIAISRALKTGSEGKIKEAMENHGKRMIDLLREHIKKENEIIYRLPEDLNID